MPIDIVIDTREQSPWQFPPDLATATVRTLKQGDYALDGDYEFAIERKSIPDFVGTVGKGWTRFTAEILRMEMANFAAKVIIVEGDIDDLYDFNRTSMPPLFLLKRIAELAFMGVTVLFAKSPVHAAALAYALFKFRHDTIPK